MIKLHLYFLFAPPSDNLAESGEIASAYVKHILNLLDRADCENGSHLYLDSGNMNSLYQALEVVDGLGEYVGVLSISDAIKAFLNDLDFKYWDDNPLFDDQEVNQFYKRFNSDNRTTDEDCKAFLKDITERSSKIENEIEEKCLIVNVGGNLSDENYISMIKGERKTHPTLYKLQIVKDFQELENWIYSNIKAKNYNHDDFRHCEDHKNFRHDKSPLMGGVGGRTNAAQLLLRALGDKRKQDYLVNYDEGNKRYIRYEFENDNPQNGYHGFHLVNQGTYEDDRKAIGLLPIRVVRLLNYRKELLAENK